MRLCLLTLLFIHLSLSAVAFAGEASESVNAEKATLLTQSTALIQKSVEQVPTEKTALNKTANQVLKQADESMSTPEVGKHVMANMNVMSMTLSLFFVLILIVVSAYILKRFKVVQQGTSQLKVISNLSLGAKERVVVVQVGEQQLVLGITAQQITLLEKLEQPLSVVTTSTDGLLNSPLLSFLKK